MNGQPPLPVAAPSGKEPPIPTEEEAGWAPVSMGILQKRKSLAPARN